MTSLNMTPDEIKHAAAATLAHYQHQAQEFWEGTRHHDVSQNRSALLEHMSVPGPFTLLDFGCGPGRDLKAFKTLGHHVIGLEGATQLAAMARAHSGCEVWVQNFLDLDLPDGHFDGVFANAVLFHVPSQVLPHVLNALFATLKPGGALFSSNPRGDGQEGWNGDRYGAFHNLQAWQTYMSAAGFVELMHYYRPTGLPFEEQTWLAGVWRKPMV